jgi:probable rRNA maturation factor
MKAGPAAKPSGLELFAGRFRLAPTVRRKIKKLFGRIQTGEKKSMKAGVVFIGDGKMRKLNRRFRRKNKTTDVLSFPLEQNGRQVEGEIYISFPQARRQAPLFENNLQGEILRLAAHGFLHLLGYNHHDWKGKKAMFAREEKYLKGFGAKASGGAKC